MQTEQSLKEYWRHCHVRIRNHKSLISKALEKDDYDQIAESLQAIERLKGQIEIIEFTLSDPEPN